MSGPTSSGSDGFWRSVAVVLTGTAAAQGIPILGSLVLARLFVPAEFGLFATWLGLVLLATVATTGRFELSLAIEPDGEPRRIGVVATLVTVAIGIAALTPAVIGVWWLTSWREKGGALFALFPPTVLALAAAQTWQSWAAAEGRFSDLSLMRIAQSAGITGLQIVAGTLAPSAVSLALSHFCGVLLGFWVSTLRLPLSLALPKTGESWRIAIAAYWRRHRRFPMLSLPADAINTAAAQLPLLFVTARFGAHAAGLLAMAMRSLGAPVSLLGASVLDVFRRRAAQSWRVRGNCRDDYTQTFVVLAISAGVVATFIGLFSESIFALAFGETWRRAGAVALWLMPMFALRFVASPLSYVFYVAGKQQWDLKWQVALLAMTLCALTFPAKYDTALIAYSAGYSVLYLVYLALSYRFSRGDGR